MTINGTWPDQPSNILAFENPCLTAEHREEGKKVLEQTMNTPWKSKEFCFIGGWNPSKGIVPLLKVWTNLKVKDLGTLHVVGKGEQEA